MSKAARAVVAVVGAVVVLLGVAVAGLALMKPKQRKASTEKIAATPERLARGEYLVHHVVHCLGCHSELETSFGVPEKPGTEGQGGFRFDQDFGVPGLVQAQNITGDVETGLGDWTDGEVLRAFREGVKRDGTALFPMMPYQFYRSLGEEDAKAILVFLRTLKPIKHKVQPRQLALPVELMIKFAPQPLSGPVTAPKPGDGLAYSKYLVDIAGCMECHTPHDDHGQRIPGREYAGGWEMKGPWGRVVTANLTPAAGTWMSTASKADFLGRFKAFASMDPHGTPAAPGRNTVMPWWGMSGMTEADLGAIYDYLKTLKAVGGPVNAFPDAVAAK
jgi:hypothetical protein